MGSFIGNSKSVRVAVWSAAFAATFLAASAAVAQPAPAASDAPLTPAEIRALTEEVRQLRTRVEQLEQRAPTQAEIDAARARVDADVAAKRNNVGFRYDKDGLLFSNEQGTFTLKPQLTLTMRYVWNHAGDAGPANNRRDRDADGFEVRRAKLTLGGTALTKQLTYQFEVTTGANGGNVTLNDAFMTYRLTETSPFFVRAGQSKNPFWHEEFTSDGLSVAAEPSLINATIGGRAVNRTQGVALIYNNYQLNDDPLTAFVTFDDGDNSRNGDFRDTSGSGTNFGATARAEYKFIGDWRSYNNLSHLGSDKELFVLGGAGRISQTGDVNVWRGAFDAQWEFAQKWALYGGLLSAYTQQNPTAGGDDTFDYGGAVQLAYVATKNVELFGRYNVTLFDRMQAGNLSDRAQELTVGANYLLGKDGEFWRQARLTLDVGWLPDGSPADFANENVSAGRGAQFITRVQFRFVL